jgi:DNA-directed RNA polymerase subunit K/omega
MSTQINKNQVANSTVTRNVRQLEDMTGNIYESVVVISKRANQISSKLKEELNHRLADFASHNDTLEEVFENREQIEISKQYERMPKPTLLATQELMDDKIYHRVPEDDNS